jgi:hypothetical protein
MPHGKYYGLRSDWRAIYPRHIRFAPFVSDKGSKAGRATWRPAAPAVCVGSALGWEEYVPDDAYDFWLDPGFQKPDAICDLLKPFDPNLMRRYEVSSRVNLVKHDDQACAEAAFQENAANTMASTK